MELSKTKNKILEFFESPLGNQIKFYALFYIILWSMHLVLISLISFFHLQLNHNIRTIGDWIGDRGWELIIFSKLIILYISVQFIRLRSRKLNSIQAYVRNSVLWPRKEFIVVVIFLTMGFMGVSQLNYNSAFIFEIHRMFFSAIGTFIFFSVDYALVVVLEIFFPLRHLEDKKRKLFLFPLLFYFFSYATFIYEQNVTLKLYPIFFFLLFVGEWRRRNWTLPLYSLIFFIVPSFFLYGLDPVWGSTYTLFFMSKPISTTSLFLLFAIASFYLSWVEKNNPEYIYRD